MSSWNNLTDRKPQDCQLGKLLCSDTIPLKYGRISPWQRKFNLKRFTCTIIHNKRLRGN